MRLRLVRVQEEDMQVGRALGDPCTDLLVPTDPAAQRSRHGQAEIVVEQRACRAGGEVVVLRASGCL